MVAKELRGKLLTYVSADPHNAEGQEEENTHRQAGAITRMGGGRACGC